MTTIPQRKWVLPRPAGERVSQHEQELWDKLDKAIDQLRIKNRIDSEEAK